MWQGYPHYRFPQAIYLSRLGNSAQADLPCFPAFSENLGENNGTLSLKTATARLWSEELKNKRQKGDQSLTSADETVSTPRGLSLPTQDARCVREESQSGSHRGWQGLVYEEVSAVAEDPKKCTAPIPYPGTACLSKAGYWNCLNQQSFLRHGYGWQINSRAMTERQFQGIFSPQSRHFINQDLRKKNLHEIKYGKWVQCFLFIKT